MGFLERLGDVVSSTASAVQAPFGLVMDLATSVPHPSEWVGTMTIGTVARGAQMLEGLMGPESAIGTGFDLLPEDQLLRQSGHQLNRGLQAAYTYGISRPVSTLMTMGSLASQPEDGFFGDWGTFADPDAWKFAYNMSESRSPGQAVALAFGTKDILDDDEVAQAVDTDFYRYASGTVDALYRWQFDPTNLVAKGIGARKVLSEPGTVAAIAAPEFASRALRYRMVPSDRLEKVNELLRQGFYRLPERVQKMIGSDAFAPVDIPRLIDNEITQLEVGAHRIRASDPAQAEEMLRKAEGIRASKSGTANLASARADELRARADQLEESASRSAGTRRTRELNQEKLDEAAKLRAEADAVPTPTTADIVEKARERLGADITTLLSPSERRSWLADNLFGREKWRQTTDALNDLEARVPGQSVEAIAERAATIRDSMFPRHGNGDMISYFLAKAEGPAEREQVFRLFMGDLNALEALRGTNVALANRAQDLLLERTSITSHPDALLDGAVVDGQMRFGSVAVDVQNTPARLGAIDEEIDAVLSEFADVTRIRGHFGSVSSTDIRPFRNRLRSAVIQDHPLARAIRFFGPESTYHHIIDFADEAADVHLARSLRRGGMDAGEIGQWRGKFMAAQLNERPGVFNAAMEKITRDILERHGLEADEIEMVLEHANKGYQGARELVMNQKPRFDGEGRAVFRFIDETGEAVEIPLLTTQLQNVAPVPDFLRLNQAAENYAVLKYGEGWQKALAEGVKPVVKAKDVGHQVMTEIIGVWKPAVLLRPAWMVRVVLLDESIGRIAKFGVLSTLLDKRAELSDMFTAMREKHPKLRRLIGEPDNVTSSTRRGAVAGAIAGTAIAGPPGAAIGSAVSAGFLRAMGRVEDAGYHNLTVNGMTVSGTLPEILRQQASIGAGVPEMLGAYESKIMAGLRRDPSQWRTYQWGMSPRDDAAYRLEWAKNMHHQIAQDKMGRQFLEGKSRDEVLNWLTNTLEGRQYGHQIPGRMRNPGNWVDAVADQVDAYTGGMPEVRTGVLGLTDKSSPAEWDKVLDLIPESARAPIHGAELEQILGPNSTILKALQGFIDNAFDVIGTMPHDELIANPVLKRSFTAEMKRRLGSVPVGAINHEELLAIEKSAWRASLRQMRNQVDDLAERSRFEELTRNLLPFFTSARQVLSRYTGLVADNPLFGTHAVQVWTGIDKTGWVTTDDFGNEYINIRLPEFAKNLINQGMFKSALDDQGTLKLNKTGFNLVLSGTPGFGPFAQIAVSEMAKERPSLEEALEFVIPNGPVTPSQAFTPTAMQRYFASTGDEDNRSFAFARNRILITKLTDMQFGKIPHIDMNDPNQVSALIGQVDDEAKQFMRLRMVAGAILPTAPVFDSPYQPYIDIYRALRDGKFQKAADLAGAMDPAAAQKLAAAQDEVLEAGQSVPDQADALFLETFGPEFFYLTQAFTKSNNGVPPTVEGVQAAAGFKDLIERHPEWGSVIVGSTAGGETVKFSRAAYDAQLEQPLRKGSALNQRSILAPEDIVRNTQVRLGWEKYSKVSDSIENLRIQMGLPSLLGKQAAPLRQLKQALVLSLAQESPQWFQDYSTRDESKWQRDIAAMQDIANDERMAGRQDIQGLAEYLKFRNTILSILETRESKTITAQGNEDIANLWHVGVTSIVEGNTAFADLYYRRLEHDPMSIATMGGGVFALQGVA